MASLLGRSSLKSSASAAPAAAGPPLKSLRLVAEASLQQGAAPSGSQAESDYVAALQMVVEALHVHRCVECVPKDVDEDEQTTSESFPKSAAAVLSEALLHRFPVVEDSAAEASADRELRILLLLCEGVFEAICCRTVHIVKVRACLDAALEAWRSRSRSMVRQSLFQDVSTALQSLTKLVSARMLHAEALRRSITLSTTTFMCMTASDSAGLAALGPATSAARLCAALVEASVGEADRASSSEIAVDSVLKHLKDVTTSMQRAGRQIASLLLQVLTALCAPPPTPQFRPAEWMPRAHADAKQISRLMAMGLLRVSAHGDAQTKSLVEVILSEVACIAARGELPAATMLVRALAGTYTALLRTRGTGDIKALGVRCLGRLVSSLVARSTAAAERLCEGCVHGRLEDSQFTEEGIESCDRCMLRSVQQQLTTRFGAQATESSCLKYLQLLLAAQTSGDQAAGSSCAEVGVVRACSFYLCDWASTLWPEGGGSTGGEEVRADAEHGVDLGRSLVREISLASASQLQHLLQDRFLCGRGAGAVARQVAQEISSMCVRAIRGILAQLKSPRAWLRTAALRALTDIAVAQMTSAGRWKVVPRSVLHSALTSDSSAHVRQAAMSHLGALLRDISEKANESGPKGAMTAWALDVSRTALKSDPSAAVQLVAKRTLSGFVRRNPSSPLVHEVCKDLLGQLEAGGASGHGCKIFDDLREYIFAEVKGRAEQLLQLFALVHRSGISSTFLQRLFRAHRAVVGPEAERTAAWDLAAALVAAFATNPNPLFMSGLQALSEGAPWTLLGHLRTISIFLAINSPPSTNEEVLALGACKVLADVLASHGCSAIRSLSPWAWARIDMLVSCHSSRLVRPAMQCLATAAAAEASPSRIHKHVCNAVSALRGGASDRDSLVRAAWIGSIACEQCDLDGMLTLEEVGQDGDGTVLGVGTLIVQNILRLCAAAADQRAFDVLPGLVLALGFALRRHFAFIGSQEVAAVFDLGLVLRPGLEQFTERSLEALAQLLDRLVSHAADMGAGSRGGAGSASSQLTPGESAASFARHQGAVLSLLSHGLHQKAQVADMRLRARALAATWALHRAGLAHPSSVTSPTVTLLFGDRTLRRGAGTLLAALAKRDAHAVASGLSRGIREAFAAMMWQAPQHLTLTGSSGLTRAAADLGGAFTGSPAPIRLQWLRALLGELQTLEKDLRNRLVCLPPEQTATTSRLSPFGGKAKLAKSAPSTCSAEAQVEVPKASTDRLVALYGSFCARILLQLPLRTSEASFVADSCKRYAEFHGAAACSAHEHRTEDISATGSHAALFAVSVSVLFCRGLWCASVAGPASRVEAFENTLNSQWPSLIKAATARSVEDLVAWLDEVVSDMDLESAALRRGQLPRRARCGQPFTKKLKVSQPPAKLEGHTPVKNKRPSPPDRGCEPASKRTVIEKTGQDADGGKDLVV